MSSELSYEASDEASESELLDRSLSVWKGWNSIELEDFTPIPLDIHTASSIGHYEGVRNIILKSEDPALDRRNHGGWTPLMYACYIGHDNIVNLLINAGCSMNMKNPRGHTPLMLAASCGNETVARTLVWRGAELELIDKTGWTALFHATYAGHQNFVAFLLEAGANKDAIEPGSGTTPLMEAAAEGHEIIVQLFLQHGANVQAKAHNGDSARTLALMNGYMNIVSLIDTHVKSLSCLRPEPSLEFYFSSSDESQPKKQQHPSTHSLHLKSQGPSIRDGPEAIARMIDRTRNTDTVTYTNALVPKGYVSFPVGGADTKEDTKLSYRDVTSPINPEDYKDSSGSRAMSDLDDFNDDSNAFTKTGAITIKSSSSSSGGLVAALGLSREGSLDSDDSHYDQVALYPGPAGNTAGVDGSRAGAIVSMGTTVMDWNQQGGYKYLTNSPARRENSNNLLVNNSVSPVKVPANHLNSQGKISLNVDTHDDGVASPIGNYFPLDSSSPIRNTSSLSSESQQKPSWDTEGKSSGLSSSQVTLPNENMTHTEIVNRFLKNLTINNPDTSPGVCQNRWADETCDRQSEIVDLSNHVAVVSSCQETSANVVDGRAVDFEGNDAVMTQRCGQAVTGFFENYSAGSPMKQPAEVVHKESISSLLPGQFSHLPNLSLHQKEVPQQLPDQPWTQHPQLNYHHPLHTRHHHHRKHIFPDSSGSTSKNNLKSKLHQNASAPNLGPAQPLFHTVPQEHILCDSENSSQQYQAISKSSLNLTAFTQSSASYSATGATNQAITADTFSRNTNPVTSNVIMNHPESKLIDGVSRISQAGGGNLKNEILPLVPAAMPSPVAVSLLQSAQSPLTQPAATIIIPGHATSQPVCSTIDWGQVGLGQPGLGLGPRDLAEMLAQLGLTKYLETFSEQDVDLQVFLSLTDNDLKELGIKLFGPRKKMTNAIARWHSNAPMASNSLEQAYADKVEGEMQEMAIQLNQACENSEHLKAQILQEQQLRSVTESCLMEERTNWEQARQILHNTRSKMRVVGDLISRLRSHHKELRKQLAEASKRSSAVNYNENSRQADSRGSEETDNLIGQSHHTTSESSAMIGEAERTAVSNVASVSSELFKKSEKCLKEMQQTLTSLVLGLEHLLESHNFGSVEKNLDLNL